MTAAPLLILATTISAGVAYAEVLGVVNYRIATPLNAASVQGLVVRAVVVSPEVARIIARETVQNYISPGAHSPATRAFDTANRNASKTGAPRG
ncbi:hypothetical protein J2Y69_003376 [Microbacterium resistens]|uniref:Uncharacterized protein n=1 Tax=Microbacterium resistens TaxID=156977 RepID=A0ABU1SGL9_9MICO|nr:hypothetical protein [Microbacterium resistens]MDR6868752.1 hypothetical protein [Microbacterium resistens]